MTSINIYMCVLIILPFLVLSYMVVYRFVRVVFLLNKDRLFPRIKKTYVVGSKRYGNTVCKSITCLRCGRTSYNQKDVEYLYCGNCHVFHERFE